MFVSNWLKLFIVKIYNSTVFRIIIIDILCNICLGSAVCEIYANAISMRALIVNEKKN